jgi:calcium-dependent protein kinase
MGYRFGGPIFNVQTKDASPQQDLDRFRTTYAATFCGNRFAASTSVLQNAPSQTHQDPDRFRTTCAVTFSPNRQAAAPSIFQNVATSSFHQKNRSLLLGKSSSTGDILLGSTALQKKTLTPSTGLSSSASQVLKVHRAITPGGLKRQSSKEHKESRRKCLETLASPNVKDIADDMFRKYDKNSSGTLEKDEIRTVLQQLHVAMDLPEPNTKIVDLLLKKFDAGGKGSLKAEEFFELFKAQLRRSAFDRSSTIGREFFITKNTADVWEVYTRQKELGVGSFGTAYLVKHKSTKEERVVKAVRKSRSNLPLEEIEQEILIMRQVDHPHIVRLFEWYEDSSRIYLVLECLKGGTLKDIVVQLQQQQQGLKEAWIRKVIQQSISAMAYCHELRLIHKDLKDENIMLLKKDPSFEEPFAVIIDLGIAEMFSVADPAGRVIGGTPLTMAPEVWGGTFGPKCDVFSLGCILFELLAGNYPFMTRNMTAAAWTRLHKRGPNWNLVRTSAESQDLCKAMLTYEESARPSMSKCLQHVFFQKPAHELNVVPSHQFRPLIAATKNQKTRQLLLLELASRLPIAKSAEIIELFDELDEDRSGTLTLQELSQYFRKIGIEDQDFVRKTFDALDIDGDGILTFTELAAGALLLFKDLLDDQLHSLFEQHDLDSDGQLNSREAKMFLQDVDAARCLDGRRNTNLDGLLRSGKIQFEDLRKFIFSDDDAIASR